MRRRIGNDVLIPIDLYGNFRLRRMPGSKFGGSWVDLMHFGESWKS